MIYQIDREVAEQLKDFFNRFNFIDKVVVFGSRARHDCNPKSDIDLCIYSLEMSAEEFTKLKFEIDELPILYKLDIVHFEKSNKELKDNIIRDEKLLFQKVLNFDDFFENLAGKKYQVSKKDYLSEGLYPIVDQGQKFIIAYSNNEDKLFSINKPVIIFGDHTRAIKYIDFNFIIGADGTKVLLAKDESIDTKYAYYHLLNTKIENLGYSRHFKILKEKTFILRTLTKQKEIASILDKAQELISLRKESIKKLDELSKSIFIDMFGDPVLNQKNWKIEQFKNTLNDVKNGLSRRGDDNNGDIVLKLRDIRKNFINLNNLNRIKLDKNEKEKFIVKENDLLFIRVNGNPDYVGRCSIFSGYSEPVYFNDHIMRINVGNFFNSLFLAFLLNLPFGRLQIKKYRKTSAGQYTISQDGLEKISTYIPPLELQNKFAKTIEKIEEQKSLYEEELEKLEENFKALLQKSFN